MRKRLKLTEQTKLRRQQILCIAAAALLSGLWAVLQRTEGDVTESGLTRAGYGGYEQTYELEVTGLVEGEEHLPVTVQVSPRAYTKEEAEAAFHTLAEELPAIILGENENLQSVTSALNLPRSLPERGIRLTWYPEDPDLISFEGEVANERLSGPQETALKAVMTDGKHSGSFVYDVTVRPQVLEGKEAVLAAFQQELTDADARQAEQEIFLLPAEFSGRKLSYRKKQGYDGAYLLALGFLAAVLLGLRAKNEEKEIQKKRREELLLDYSELVSKFIVYLGAGLTIRNAWQKIAEHYRSEREQGLTQKRCVYEEMLTTLQELGKGIPEANAYQAFGRRCGLQPYVKFCTLLEQNRRNGGGNLKPLLTAEMETAFEERKNAARRRGEEAGTKLLLPLFMMLIIVMVIVILPAMLSMG